MVEQLSNKEKGYSLNEQGIPQLRYPVFSEEPRRGQNFSKFDREKGSELLADRAQLFAMSHPGTKYSDAIKLVARRDGLGMFI